MVSLAAENYWLVRFPFQRGLAVVYLLLSDVDPTVLALVRAFGAGAVLATMADEILPDAYREGGPAVAFATAAGFVVTFVFT